MNPTAALMLSREFEADRRRALAQRRKVLVEPGTLDLPPRRERTSIWSLLLRIPRFGPAR